MASDMTSASAPSPEAMLMTVWIVAVPLFVLAMLLEWAWSRRRPGPGGQPVYGLADTLASLSQGLLSQGVGLLTPAVQLGLYAALQPRLGLLPARVWQAPWAWGLAVLLYDFCDYWLHRASHEVAFFWAAHAVHHQSEHFNLSTALRQESLYGVLGWPFFLPMAVLGVPVPQFLFAGVVVLVYQFWIHTELIGRLGWLDRVFSTPSNHRVHHAVNPGYLDRNYGAILVLWDRLFGSFAPETEPCVYGTVQPLASWRPGDALLQGWRPLWRHARATPRWADKWRVFTRPPGWLPPGVAPASPASPASPVPLVAPPALQDLHARQRRPRPETTAPRAARVAAVLGFVALAAGTGAWLATAGDEPGWRDLVAFLGLLAGLSGVGRLLSRCA